MGIEQLLLEKLREIPPGLHLQVLDFLEHLKSTSQSRTAPLAPRRSLRGLWADLGIDITEEDIAEIRREMWHNFPRGDI